MSSTTSSASSSTTTANLTGEGSAQGSEGISLTAFIAALAVGLIVFGIQVLVFLLIKNKLARIYKPKTYLVSERERTEPPPRSPWGWLFAIFRFRDREVINKCGLDAYFFLRYLQTLLLIFVPLAVVLLPILLPLNYTDGRGSEYALEVMNKTGAQNVTGLDQISWSNIRPNHTHRYWAHLILALVVIIWVCGVFFSELKVYIKVRQDYLTSAEHRLRASATTVLVSAIPDKWLSTEALAGLYDVFPGGIRNIWINRNYDALLDKIKLRNNIHSKLEAAETDLIKAAKKAHKKQMEKEAKAAAKSSNVKTGKHTKEEKAQQMKNEDEKAQQLAESGGVSTGDPDQVQHTVDDAVDDAHEDEAEKAGKRHNKFKVPVIGSLATVGAGLGKGLGAAGNLGGTVLGGARQVGQEINGELETTNGFVNLDSGPVGEDETFDQYGRFRDSDIPSVDEKESGRKDKEGGSPTSSHDPMNNGGQRLPGNTTRKPTFHYGIDGANDSVNTKKWYQFWKPPSGGFASPVPTGYEDSDEFPFKRNEDATPGEKKGVWAKVKVYIPFLGGEEIPPLDYPIAYNEDYKEDATGAAWEKYLKAKDRPTHRLARFTWTPGWLPGIPKLNKKVDTIYWCRGELARLNLEIEMDQKHPERYPLMNSAFIQFNHQVAAHMAAQSITHHVPRHMSPRTVEISPNDVIWDNMAVKWWEGWVKTAIVVAVVVGMIILWTFPVAFTASLAQITELENKYSWLAWLKNTNQKVIQAIAGVLGPLLLSILLLLVPLILTLLAKIQGAQTGVQQQKTVQSYYFAFLFIQVFLVVSISGGVFAAITSIGSNVLSVPSTLASQLPKAANYFFSYMILQALSTSAGTLLQVVTLVFWFILPKLFDNTARQKWNRNTSLPTVTWGTYYPVYTNFACIALVYSVVAPIIILFAIITFTLLWIANRYNMLYVSRFKEDTGGLLYPTAINQTFTGLYFMELCLVGLFFLVRDANDNASCVPQAIIMIVSIFLTILFQVLLNYSFAPLFQYLPITFEDEAVLRDQAFEHLQARRLGLEHDDDQSPIVQQDGAVEMAKLPDTKSPAPSKLARFNPAAVVQEAGSWAARSGRNLGTRVGLGNAANDDGAHNVLRKRKHRDIEAQQRIADALYGGYHDELEDLTPDERDILVKHAFKHEALRATRPVVWIPRDDIGVSDDEVKRSRDFAGANIWISNVGAALDRKGRVVYGKNPPDFSEVDLINL